MRANECFVPALYAMILIVGYCGVIANPVHTWQQTQIISWDCPRSRLT